MSYYEQYTDHNGDLWRRECWPHDSGGGFFHPVDPVAVVASEIGIDRDALEHARQCLDSATGWDVDSLGFNIESNFPDISPGECDEIAAFALMYYA